MSDVDQLELEAEALRESLEAEGVRLCRKCGIRPVKDKVGDRGPMPTLCEECTVDPRTRTRRGSGGPQEAPGSININLGAPAGRKSKADAKKDRDAATVEAKAAQLAQMIVIVLTMVQQGEDATIVQNGAEQWAKAVGGLGPYEPWLVKLCEGGETAGRAMAWLTAILATLGIAVPVLIHHNLIPAGPLQQAFAGIAATAAAA